MFGLRRLSPFDDIFSIQRDVDRAFNQFWNELPARTAAARNDFQVTMADDGWRINVPLPGIDPQHVSLEVAGDTVSIRAQVPEGSAGEPVLRYEQTLTVPEFLDTDKLAASQNHGMLQLFLPLKESIKPRKVEIESKDAVALKGAEAKPLAAAAEAKPMTAAAGAAR
jgi:HSP20 family protein